MKNEINKKVDECIKLLDTFEDKEIVAKILFEMFYYESDRNMECPHCGLKFPGDETWDDGDGNYGTDCIGCGKSFVTSTYKRNQRN